MVLSNNRINNLLFWQGLSDSSDKVKLKKVEQVRSTAQVPPVNSETCDCDQVKHIKIYYVYKIMLGLRRF